eukprot:6175050-Pleurochrysis_carterae.AAC.4
MYMSSKPSRSCTLEYSIADEGFWEADGDFSLLRPQMRVLGSSRLSLIRPRLYSSFAGQLVSEPNTKITKTLVHFRRNEYDLSITEMARHVNSWKGSTSASGHQREPVLLLPTPPFCSSEVERAR